MAACLKASTATSWLRTLEFYWPDCSGLTRMIHHWPNAHPGVYFIASNTRPNVAVDQAREAQLANALFLVLDRDREATAALFEIIKNQPGYL